MVGVEYLLAHSPRVLGTEERLSLVEGYFRSLIDQGILEPDYVRGRASESPLNETDDHLKKIAEDTMEKENFLDTSFIRAQVLDSKRIGAALSQMVGSVGNLGITIETYLVNGTASEPPAQ